MLQPTLLSYLDGHELANFQQDNARPHVARRTKNFLPGAEVNLIQRHLIHRI